MSFGQETSFRLDSPVGSASISPCGRDVVLASRDGLHIIDLDSPYSPPRYLPHHTSWDVADVQWSPFASRDYWVVSTSNQKALVWNLEAKYWQNSIEFVLHGHTRAITDINFSAHHADILATCAVDSYVHCWDLRTPSRPAVSFSDWFAGATQVKWNRQDSHVIASSHDRYLRIWDDRNGAYPVHTIEAHHTKIYGVDWNRFETNKIVTCSLDKTIKFWNLDKIENSLERTIKTPFPIARARHTPFGWGLLAMPQRGNYDLHLYDRRSSAEASKPVRSFAGHKAQVKEFLWRAEGPITDGVDHRDFQLVTWGADRELKLHPMDTDVLADIGYEKGLTQVKRLKFTRRNARYKTFRDEPDDDASPFRSEHRRQFSSVSAQAPSLRPRGSTSVGMSKISLPLFRGWAREQKHRSRTGMHGRRKAQEAINAITWMKSVRIDSWEPENLADEITQVGDRFKKVDFENVDINARRATITLHAPWGENNTAIYIRADLRFPQRYPQDIQACLRFKIQKTAAMSDSLLDLLTTDLQTISETYAKRRKGCLEAFLRYLLRDQSLEQAISSVLDDNILDPNILAGGETEDQLSSDDDDDQIAIPSEALKATDPNVLVPLAKACGALWSDSGKLVCFFPPKVEQPSMMDSIELPGIDQTRDVRRFEGFGRLQNSSPGPRTTLGTKTTAEDDTLSESSDVSASSSTSSTSSDTQQVARSGLLPRRPRNKALGALRHLHSPGHSNRSKNALADEPGNGSTRTNVVSIHDFSDLIPSQPTFALHYRIFGPGPEVCAHNAQVAVAQQADTLADSWMLAQLILENRVPLELLHTPDADEDILVIAKRLTKRLNRKDSGVNLTASHYSDRGSATMSSRVRWGNSPLASTYLIPAMFEHYEALGDIQMLAMMSCVFAEPEAAQPEILLMPHKDRDLAIELKAPAFSLDYFPSLRVALSQTRSRQKDNSPKEPTNSKTLVSVGYGRTRQPLNGGIKAHQPGESDRGSIVHSRRPSNAASLFQRDSKGATSNGESTSISLSTSPEESRLSRVASTTGTLPFLKSALAIGQSKNSQSPPGHLQVSSGQKAHSPSTSLVQGNWNAAALFGGQNSLRSSRNSQQGSAASSDELRSSYLPSASSFSNLRSFHHDTSLRTSDGSGMSVLTYRNGAKTSQTSNIASPEKASARVRTTLTNQAAFDLDGYVSVPLLDPALGWKYRSYRANYAHLLGVWRLYPQMTEVLKFDGLASYFPMYEIDSYSGSGGLARPKMTMGAAVQQNSEGRGLEVRRCCIECGSTLAAIEKNNIPIGWHCTIPSCSLSTSRHTPALTCFICYRSIEGLMLPCLECGHATCFECGEEWHNPSMASNEDKNKMKPDNASVECPSGCGCMCGSMRTVSVHVPQEEVLDEQEEAPLTMRFERQKSQMSQRSQRLMSTHGPDTAIGAFLALTRTRSVSAAKESMLRHQSVDESAAVDDEPVTPNGNDELDPWANSKFTTLGRGFGGGLSRGLSKKSSDATIRKGDVK